MKRLKGALAIGVVLVLGQSLFPPDQACALPASQNLAVTPAFRRTALSCPFVSGRRTLIRNSLAYGFGILFSSFIGHAQPQGAPYGIPFPIETDETMRREIKERLINLLDKRLSSPGEVGATSVNDPIYQAILAFRNAAKSVLIVVKAPSSAGTIVGSIVTFNGRPTNVAVVNSLFFGPLLKLASLPHPDPFIENLLLLMAVRAGAAAAEYRISSSLIQLEELLHHVQIFTGNPFTPSSGVQYEEVRKMVGGVLEWISVGPRLGAIWLFRAGVKRTDLEINLPISPEVDNYKLSMARLLSDISQAKNAEDRELIGRLRVFRFEFAGAYPALAQAFTQLPELRGKSDFYKNLETMKETLGWLSQRKYLRPTWTEKPKNIKEDRRAFLFLAFPGLRKLLNLQPLPRVAGRATGWATRFATLRKRVSEFLHRYGLDEDRFSSKAKASANFNSTAPRSRTLTPLNVWPRRDA